MCHQKEEHQMGGKLNEERDFNNKVAAASILDSALDIILKSRQVKTEDNSE
jgi:hypothetical protein